MQLQKELNKGWRALLQDQFNQSYFKQLEEFLVDRVAAGAEVYPPLKAVFSAMNITDPCSIKTVILGQDPYHNPGQAHGLAFSVPDGQAIPPSLGNILRELESDLGFPPPRTGSLNAWAEKGVLLLNTVLTVERGAAGAHRKKGWELFTNRIIQVVNEQCLPSVFLLWGNDAQKKASLIDDARHLVLKAAHPSPLSAYRGFLGCRHFSKCNAFLLKHGREPVDWCLQ